MNDDRLTVTLRHSKTRAGTFGALSRTCQQLRSEFLPIHAGHQSRWTTAIALEDINTYVNTFSGESKHYAPIPRKLCVMLKSLVAPQSPPPVDLVPLLLYRRQFSHLVLAFVVDRCESCQHVANKEEAECYGLNIALSSHTRIAKDVACGKIISATYTRVPGSGGQIQVVIRPELSEVYAGQVWRGMAASRMREIESRYYQSIPLGRNKGGWYDFDVDVRLDLNGITPSQWAAKTASDRATRPKKHNMYFLRCINP